MGKYTTEVRYICETSVSESVQGNGFNSVDEIISKSRANVFNFNYPIFDEAYRPVLETKILRHYYTREISEETVGLWKLRLSDKLNLIMPYYNQLYQSELIEFNPLYDVDLTTSHGGSKEGSKSDNVSMFEQRDSDEGLIHNEIVNNTESVTNSENTQDMGTETSNRDNSSNETRTNSAVSTNSNTVADSGSAYSATSSNDSVTDHKLDKYSDTPQGRVQNLDDGYLTNVRDITDTTNSNSASSGVSDTNSNRSENGVSSQSNVGDANITENDSYNSTKSYAQNSSKEENRDREENRNRMETRNKSDNRASNKDTTTTMTNIEQYINRVNGKRGTMSYSKMLIEFRQTFLNIDAMIIEELNELFFGLW